MASPNPIATIIKSKIADNYGRDASTWFEESLPSATISEIIVDANKVEVVHAAIDRRYGNCPGPENPFQRPPKTTSNGDPGDETTEIIPDNQDPFEGAWYQEEVNYCSAPTKIHSKYLKFHIILSFDAKLTSHLIKGKIKALKRTEMEGKYISKIVGIKDHEGAGPSTQTLLGNRVHQFLYRNNFDIREHISGKVVSGDCVTKQAIGHLAVIVYSFVDVYELNRDFNINLSCNPQSSGQVTSSIMSKINYKILFKGGIRQSRAFYYDPKTGKEVPESGIRGRSTMNGGHFHSYIVNAKGDGHTLEVCSPEGVCHAHKIKKGKMLPAVGGSGIHNHSTNFKKPKKAILNDYSLLNEGLVSEIKSLDINFSPRRAQQKHEPQKYIPTFVVACDQMRRHPESNSDRNIRQVVNTGRFYFDVDILKILKDTEYGAILDNNLDQCCLERILELSKIVSIKVVRVRKEERDNQNKYITKDLESLIAQQSDNQNSDLPPIIKRQATTEKSQSQQGTNSRTGTQPKVYKGSIEEIFMNHRQGVRTFTGVDYNLPDQGKYQYCVKVKIKNGIIAFLNEKLKVLVATKTELKGWSEFSSQMKFIDAISKKFNMTYREVIKCLSIDLTPPQKSIKIYIMLLGCLMRFKCVSKEQIIQILLSMTNTTTGNPAGIEFLVGLLNTLEARIRSMLGINITAGPTGQNSTGTWTSFSSQEKVGIRRSSKTLKNVIEFEKCSNIIDCSCDSKEAYYDFLGIKEDFYSTIKMLSTPAYITRAKQERDKYHPDDQTGTTVAFDDIETGAETEGDSGQTSGQTNPDDTIYSHLSPRALYLQGHRFDLSTLRDDQDYYDNLKLMLSVQNNKNSGLQAISRSGQHQTGGQQKNSEPDFCDKNQKSALINDSLRQLGVTVVQKDQKTYDAYTDQGQDSKEFQNSAEYFTDDDEFANPDQEELNELYSLEISEEALKHLNSDCPERSQDPSCPTSVDFGDYRSIQETPSSSDDLPAQLTAMARGSAGDSERDLRTSIDLESKFYFNYNVLVQVEAMEYERSVSGPLVQVWRKLSKSKLQALQKNSDRPVLCRTRRYIRYKYGMRDCPRIDLQICYNYFIIGDASKRRRWCDDEKDPVGDYIQPSSTPAQTNTYQSPGVSTAGLTV